VELPAADEVQMKVRHNLAAIWTTVQDEAIAPLRHTFLLRDGSGAKHHPPDETFIFGSKVLDRGDMPAGHQEDVRRGNRMDIPESDHLVILEDEFSGNLA